MTSKLPILIFPEVDAEDRCIECGSYLHWCEECQRIWVGRHTCEEGLCLGTYR